MNATVLIVLSLIGLSIAFIIYFKGNKSLVAVIVGVMSIMVFIVGINGYREIKKDAAVYQPLAIQWLQDKTIDYGNYSIYCIYYSPDYSRVVMYVELSSASNDLVMVFNRKNKTLEGVHEITKDKKPQYNLQNKLDPAIDFY